MNQDKALYRWVKATADNLPNDGWVGICQWKPKGLNYSTEVRLTDAARVRFLQQQGDYDVYFEQKIEADQQEELWKAVGKKIMDGYDNMEAEIIITHELIEEYILIRRPSPNNKTNHPIK